jgi:hypothetical protein
MLRPTDGDRLRQGDRQMRREAGQPRSFELRLSSRPVDPREPDNQLCTDSPDRVVGTPGFDDFERQADQVGELGCEEPADELVVNVDFIVMHALSHRQQSSGQANSPRCEYPSEARGAVP